MSVSDVNTLQCQEIATGDTRDTEHERALFQLMGQLEQILARLDSLTGSKRLPGSIEIAKELLVGLIEFSEQRFEKTQTSGLIEQVCDFHELTKRFERMLGGQSWNGFAALIGIKMSYSDEIKAMFQQIGRDLLEVVGNFFQLFESRFQSMDQASDWQASSQVFLDELVRKWNVDEQGRSFK